MTTRIREGQVTAVLIDEWYEVQLNSFHPTKLEIMSADSSGSTVIEYGFVFTVSGTDHVMAGPLDQIRALRMVKE